MALKSVCDAAPNGSSSSTTLGGALRSIAVAEAASKLEKPAQAPLNEGGAAGGPQIMSLLRIVLVENDAVIADLIAETLESMGHEVCSIAFTETDAVAAAARYLPDLLIVDVNLDEGGGLAAVERILLNGPVPYIFMSGDPLIGMPLNSGAITLRKPFQDHDLARAIRLAFAVDPSR